MNPFENKNILVVGDLMLDIYKYGVVHRISPEAPVPVVKLSNTKLVPGGAANVAINASALGCNVEIAGYVGADRAARQIKLLLAEYGIGQTAVIESVFPTITKTRILANQQHLIRYDDDSCFETEKNVNLYENELLKSLTQINTRTEFDILIISDYAKGVFTERTMNFIKQIFQCPIVGDIKPINSQYCSNFLCISPNLSEARQLVPNTDDDIDVARLAVMIKNHLNLRSVIITMSDKGIFLLDENDCVTSHPPHIPITKNNLNHTVDVTGAGDTVISTLASCIAAGYSLQESVKISNIAAGIVVNKTGTACCTFRELKDEYIQL